MGCEMAVLSEEAFSENCGNFRLRFNTVQHDPASRQRTITRNDRLTTYNRSVKYNYLFPITREQALPRPSPAHRLRVDAHIAANKKVFDTA